MSQWRLIYEDNVSPEYGLAADETLARLVGTKASRTTLRLYTYSPCVLVGRFQTLESELRLDRCKARGVPVNRRPTGGGAIVMGPEQLGVALTIRQDEGEKSMKARELMARFSRGVERGVAKLGVSSSFRGKNDIEVDGKKLAGLGIYRGRKGGLLFHASLLVDLDVAYMLDVLSTPFDTITDELVAKVAKRVTTVRNESGRGTELTLDEVRENVANGFSEAFEVELERGEYGEGELEEIQSCVESKYSTQRWVNQHIDVPDRIGVARTRTDIGMLEVRVTTAGSMLKAVFIGGDFFVMEGAIADLEGILRWHPLSPDRLRETIGILYEKRGSELEDLPMDALVKTISQAAESANDSSYGCFVNPRGGE